MASSKTIALKIALNGEREFRAAMQAVKKETSLLQTELKQLDDKYKDNRNSMEALEARQKTLSEAQEAYTKRVKAASDGLENAKKNEQDQAKRLEELRDQLDEARKAMEAMEKAGDTTSEAYQEQKKKVEELSQAVKDQTVIQAKAEGAVSDWRKELSTAQHNLDECNEEIQKNDKYLEEAKQSADGCATSIDKYGDEVGEAAKESDKLSVSLGDMVKNKVVDLLGDALVELGRKAIEAAKYCVEVGSSFEAQMDKVAAISGATGSDLDKLTKKAQEMGATTKFSATESAEALEYMAMAGWGTQDMLDGLEGIMNLAAASGEDLATTSDIVTDALTAFGESADQSGRLADIMAAASNKANTNVGMMGETFKYAAPVAGALGYSMEDTAVAIGLMANAGTKASQAGTSLRSGLTRLAAPTKQVSEAMDKYGISLTDTDGKMLTFRELMEQLREKLGGLSEVEQTAAASALFGKNAMTGWLAVINGSDEDFDKLTTAIDNSRGAAEEMSGIMQDNLAGKLEILNSALEGLGLAVYNYVSGPLQSVVEFVTGIISGITALISPQKTELETFIDDIQKANDEVERTLDHANKTVEGGDAKAAEIEAYKGMLDGILDSCEEFNLVTLDTGEKAIVDSSGNVVQSFKEIDTKAGGTEDILEKFASGGFNTAGIEESSTEAQNQIGYIKTEADTVEERLKGFAESGINTEGLETSRDAIVQIFGEDEGGIKHELIGYKTKIDELGNVTIDTTGIKEPVSATVTVFEEASGKVKTFSADLESLNGNQVNLSQIATQFTEVEDSVKRTYVITDEFTKAKINRMVETLGDSVQGLADAWNAQTGELTASRDELEKWFDTAKEVAKYKGLEKALQEIYDAWGDASANVIKAQSAMSELIKQFNEENGTSYKNIEELQEATSILYGGYGKLGKSIRQTNEELQNVNATMAKADEAVNTTGAALNEMKADMDAQAEAAKEAEEANIDTAKSVEGLGDESEDAAEDVEKLTQKQQEAIDTLKSWDENITDEFLAGLRDQMQKSKSDFADWAQDIIDNNEKIKESYRDLVEKISGELNQFALDVTGEGNWIDNIEKNLQDANARMKAWVDNMTYLRDRLAEDPGFQKAYDALVDMGVEKGADAAAAFSDAFRNGNYEQVGRIESEIAKSLDLANSAELIASGTSTAHAYDAVVENESVAGLQAAANTTIAEAARETGQKTSENLSQGITDQSPLIEEALDNSVTEATDSATAEAENANATGETMATSTKEGIESTKEEVRQATESMISDARETGETIASEFHRVGQIIPQKVRQGIDEANGMGIGPASSIESMMQQALDAVDNAKNRFYVSGWNSATAVAQGIIDSSHQAVNAAIDLANAVNNAFNDTLQIHSPSKVFEESAVHSVEGVEVGFEKETPKAVQKAMKTAEEVAEAYNKGAEKARTDKIVEDLNLSVIHDSAEKISPLSSMTDSAMSIISSANDRTQAAINKLAAEIGRKLDDLAEALRVTVVAEFGTEQFDARAIRVVKKAISNDNQALKISRGR